jgi:hypothetical protein
LGHAIWVHDRYVEELSADDGIAYSAEYEQQGSAFAAAMSEVPAAYRAIRAVSQLIGPMFIETLRSQDPRLIERALSTDIPAALDQVSLPVGKYLRRDALEPVNAPAAPIAGDVQYTNQMGPFALYLLLSTGLADNEALTAADGWGNDRYTAYLLNGRVCVDVHLVADSLSAADLLVDGLNGWARARPAAAGALVARRGVHLYASVCDPGADAAFSPPTQAAIDLYLARAQEMQQRTATTGKPALAECVALAFFAHNSFDYTDPYFDYWSDLDTVEQQCLDSV